MQGSHNRGGGILEGDFDTGSNAVTVGFLAVSGEVEGDEGGLGLEVVAEEPDPGCGAVGDPDVEVAIAIIIDESDGPGVIGKIPADRGGDVSEASAVTAIEEGIVGLATTE